MKIDQWMKQSGVAFGTSGARGLVDAMTDAVCFAYTVGYLRYLAEQGEFSPQKPVAVAGDLRPSTPRILKACVAAIESMQGVPVFCGYVPTPALCLYAFDRCIPSLMVTGSHIPADRNGIKFNRAQGEFLKPDEAGMRCQDVVLPDGWFDADGTLIHPIPLPDTVNVIPAYVARYRDFFGADALSGLTLGIYEHSAVGRDALVSIVEALGAKAVRLGRTEEFTPVDTEAVRSEDCVLARHWAQDGQLDAILTTDGDSDRPLLADGKGEWLRGDVLGIVAARYLAAKAITTPVSSNTALERSGLSPHIYRTRIGSPFVVAGMMAAVDAGQTPSVGYEANGGFLLASDVTLKGRTLRALPTRDSVLPMLCVLVAAQQAHKNVQEIILDLPHRFTVSDRIVGLPTSVSQEKLFAFKSNIENSVEQMGLWALCGTVMQTDETDGLRMTFDQGDIVHIRPSGNAPELRVYVEADTQQRATTVLKFCLHALEGWRGDER